MVPLNIACGFDCSGGQNQAHLEWGCSENIRKMQVTGWVLTLAAAAKATCCPLHPGSSALFTTGVTWPLLPDHLPFSPWNFFIFLKIYGSNVFFLKKKIGLLKCNWYTKNSSYLMYEFRHMCTSLTPLPLSRLKT